MVEDNNDNNMLYYITKTKREIMEEWTNTQIIVTAGTIIAFLMALYYALKG